MRPSENASGIVVKARARSAGVEEAASTRTVLSAEESWTVPSVLVRNVILRHEVEPAHPQPDVLGLAQLHAHLELSDLEGRNLPLPL
jgi:hypothetical protein